MYKFKEKERLCWQKRYVLRFDNKICQVSCLGNFIQQAVYSDEHRFQQDKDPKHASSQATTFMDHGINWWKPPPEPLDLNPIELLWHEPKPFLGKVVKPKNKNELLEGITRFWIERVTPTKCQTYICHLHMVVQLVVALEETSGQWKARCTESNVSCSLSMRVHCLKVVQPFFEQ